ncbi:MAG: hypothetical protein KKF41_13585 [Actinobacteria bacterium]|nr:hypothetical protein [Actinomycetota bacterium]
MAERYGKGDVERVGRLWVLHLRGTSFERGLQHGTLMRYRVADTFNFYRSLPETLLSRAMETGSVRARGLKRLKRSMVSRLVRNRDSEAVEEMHGLAVGLGLREDVLAEALVLADVFQVFGALAERRRKAGPPVLTGMGCTSAVRATASGLLFARNFDFWGPGYWDANPALIFHHPDTGRAFCSIATAGFPTGGVTSINEDGLAVAVHQHGSRDSSLSGTPIIDIAHSVIRKAGSVEEALGVLEGFRATGGWSLVLASGSPADAAVVEMSSRGMAVRRLEGKVLAASNCFIDPGMAEREIQASTSATLSDHARYRRALDLASTTRVTPSGIAGILGDHHDPFAEAERSAGLTISRITNVSSVLFSLPSGRFWVSESPAPTGKGGFVGFDLDAELSGGRSSIDRLEGARPPRARTTAAQDRYLAAYKEYIDTGDLNRVLDILAECSELDPREASFPFMEGVLRSMVGNLRGAGSSIDRALELERVPPKRAVIELWRARVNDLDGDRGSSGPVYKSLAAEPDTPPLVRKAASRGVRHQFGTRDLGRLILDFTNAETFE